MDPISVTEWQDILSQTYNQLIQQLIAFAPKLLGTLVLLLIGWVVALLLAKAARSAIIFLNRMLTRLFPSAFTSSPLHSYSYSDIIGKIVFWLILLFFIAACANSLGLDIFSRWMDLMLTYLPRLIAGILIMVGGYLLGNVIRIMTTSAAQSINFQRANLFGRSVQYSVFFVAIVIGIEQLGINIQFFTQFFIVLSAVVLGGFSLAFALGAKYLIANIVGSLQAQKLCKLGDKLQVGEIEGVLIEISNTILVLETRYGRTTVPAKYFIEHITHIHGQQENTAKEI